MTLLRIAGGAVYDPTNNVDGAIHDIWIRDGRIVADPSEPADRTLDATGLVVMPGGVDLHSHIVGSKVNAGRRLRPDDRRQARPIPRTPFTRSGTAGSVPSTFATGYLYTGLGYTTAIDAAIAPSGARHAHMEFADTPVIDKAFLALMGNNVYALEQIAAGETSRLRDYVAWLLAATKAYGIKIVNPGGVERWKRSLPDVEGLDAEIDGLKVTPRAILTSLVDAANNLGLPHSAHIHCNHLGLPGNAATTEATMNALSGRRAHLTHIQFHSYGGTLGDQASFSSRVAELAAIVNRTPELTVDVGQVLFGDTTAMTADSPVGYYLHRVTGRRWTNADTEMEAGCGVVPIEYKEKSFVHALQWAIGLEWFLLVTDPWRIVLTTDHPNGGAFIAYPEIVQLLMSRDYRREVLGRVSAKVRARCHLADLDREYTLGEIAIVTRAGPARILGLKHKGHLGPGADADVTIYSPGDDKRAMFALPRFVLKAGRIVAEQGEIREELYGLTCHVAPEHDPAVIAAVQPWFESHLSTRFEDFPVDLSILEHGQREVACLRK
jgi:formylmethanofuran dehydrogenase subunit A